MDSDIKAYEKDQGTVLWWGHEEWKFKFISSALSHDVLKELDKVWDNQGADMFHKLVY